VKKGFILKEKAFLFAFLMSDLYYYLFILTEIIKPGQYSNNKCRVDHNNIHGNIYKTKGIVAQKQY